MKGNLALIVGSVMMLGNGGCASPRNNDTSMSSGLMTIHIVGPPGADIEGDFLQDGQRREFMSRLPFTLGQVGVSEFTVVKVHPEQTISLSAQVDHGLYHYEVMGRAGEHSPGLRVQVNEGLTVRPIRPSFPQ